MAKTIAGKIIASIIDLFKNNFPDFVQKLFKKIPEDIQDKVKVIIEVVRNIERFAGSQEADLLTRLIPGNIDDELKHWIKEHLPEVLEKLDLIWGNREFQSIDLPTDKELKAAQLHSIASILTKRLTGTSFGQAAITTEVVYKNS